MTKRYHVGLGKAGKTLLIQAVTDRDCLDCEIIEYMGVQLVTKDRLHEHRYQILTDAQRRNPAAYGQLKYAAVY